MFGGEIDLSPAAKSHCMRLSDREHYSQSPWINSTAAPHDPVAFPQTNYLIHKRCMMGEPLEHSILKPPDQAGGLLILSDFQTCAGMHY